MILAIFRNGNEVTPLNMLGMVICLSGIFAHVLRKAMASENGSKSVPRLNLEDLSSDDDDNDSENRYFRPRSSANSKTKIEDLPLLCNSDSEDDLNISPSKKYR